MNCPHFLEICRDEPALVTGPVVDKLQPAITPTP